MPLVNPFVSSERADAAYGRWMSPLEAFFEFLIPAGSECDNLFHGSSARRILPDRCFCFFAFGYFSQFPFRPQPILQIASGLAVLQINFVSAFPDLFFTGLFHGTSLFHSIKRYCQIQRDSIGPVPKYSSEHILLV